MAYTTVPSVVTGQTYSAANWNTYVKDNLTALWVYTTAGDIAYAASATTLARLELVEGGVLIAGASAPEWLVPGDEGDHLVIDAGVPTWQVVTKVFEIQVVAESVEVDTTTGIAYFHIPAAFDGMNLIRAQAMVGTAGTTNATTIQVRNMTKYSGNDALSSAISIASAGTVGTVGTVNASYDDVSTNDKIKIYVTAQSTTKPKGLWVVLEFQLP